MLLGDVLPLVGAGDDQVTTVGDDFGIKNKGAHQSTRPAGGVCAE